MKWKTILFASAFIATIAITAFSSGLLTTPAYAAAHKNNQSSGNTLLNTNQVIINGQTVFVLTTFNQMTLYYNSHDTASSSSCTISSCTQTWHPLQSNGNVFVSGYYPIKGTLTTQKTANGPQVEYTDVNGMAHLLYTYAGDTAPGQVNGQGQGGIWYAVQVRLAPSHW